MSCRLWAYLLLLVAALVRGDVAEFEDSLVTGVATSLSSTMSNVWCVRASTLLAPPARHDQRRPPAPTAAPNGPTRADDEPPHAVYPRHTHHQVPSERRRAGLPH